MGFDDEVDAARRKLEAAVAAAEPEEDFDDVAALEALLPKLSEKINSRRLVFQMGDDEEDPTIDIIHADTDEPIGFVFVTDGEYVFESNLDAYFDDFVDEDPESFVQRLYETLRSDLPKYEVENR